MLTPLATEIKEKVISAYLMGKSRNQIDRELHEQGIKVSHGSISNIINAYKKSQYHQEPPQSPDIPSLSNMDNQDKTSSYPGVGLNSESEPIDFSDNPAYETTVDNMLSGNYNPAMDGRQGEQLLYGIQTVEPEQVDISPPNYNKHAEVTQIKKTPEEPDQNQPSSRPSNPAHQIRPTEEEDSDLGLDWDKTHQSRFVKWVFQQKKDQRAERGRLDIYWRCWKQERHLLEERKKELSEAEVDLANRIYQIKPLLPVAQSLKELGFDFNLANSWITCVSQMVQSKGIGMREAAWKVAEEIQNLEYLGGINKAIDQQKHQLELLEMAIEDKKEAFAALADLKKQNIGVREILEVMETIKKNSSRSEPDSSQQEEDSN